MCAQPLHINSRYCTTTTKCFAHLEKYIKQSLLLRTGTHYVKAKLYMRRLKVCYDYRVVFICLFVGKFHTNLLLITFQLVKFVYCNASIRYLSSGEIYCFGAVPVESLNFSGVPKTLSSVCVCVYVQV